MEGRSHPQRPSGDAGGFTLVELIFALGVIGLLSAVSLASVQHSLDEARAAGAARYIASLLQRTRTAAVVANAYMGTRFESAAAGYAISTYADGDDDGVLTADIDDGVDVVVGRSERLDQHFPGVQFGTLPGLPAIDVSGAAPGIDPIRLGASDTAVFTPIGTATSGTLYILGAGQAQFAVRIFGETGRTRVLRFDVRSGQWEAVGR